jgi:N-acetylglucosamine-6-sulfatase
MGYDDDSPRRGFHHWVGFKGQGSYTPGPNTLINVNGRHVPQKGYITDELTDYAVEWLSDRDGDQPFFLYLSHKAVHSNFTPAERHQGNYTYESVPHPPTMPDTPERRASQPRWVTDRRASRQGIGSTPQDFDRMDATYRKYCEAVVGIDDSIGRVLGALQRKGLLESTLVIYMGDNGFSWGEHGLTNKRHPYEESMHIPLLMRCPPLFEPNTTVNAIAANIDIAPTILHAAGLKTPAHMDGQSLVPLARGDVDRVRDHLVYEYFWERRYATTPTFFAIRTERHKYIFPYGVPDTPELYDLKTDPHEQHNLVGQPQSRELEERLDTQLFEELTRSGALKVALDFYKRPRR